MARRQLAPLSSRKVIYAAIAGNLLVAATKFVAAAWTKLYGFPLDPRLWAAFVLHDIGYVGCESMDGTEGTLHPYSGASLMGILFDSPRGPVCG